LIGAATIGVDQTEFVVGKLKDRGTHQAFGWSPTPRTSCG